MGKTSAASVVDPAPSTEGTGGVLSDTNTVLTDKLGLAPLTSIGGAPGWEIANAPKEFHVNPFYAVAGIPCLDPDRKPVTKWMRFMGKTASGRRGTILVVMVSDGTKDGIATVEQFRLPILLATGSLEEARTTELPRYHTTTGMVQSLYDKALRHDMIGKTNTVDPTILEDVRTLLGSELQALLPHTTVEAIEALGSYVEWDESMVPVEVVLVRLRHPNVESLRQKDLGPPHMKIRLYPFSQLLVNAERDKLHLRDEHSLAGLALAWGWCQRTGHTVHAHTPVHYPHDIWSPVGEHGRELKGLNKILTARGHRLLNTRGGLGAAGEIYGLTEDPWFSDERSGWEVVRATNRLPNGVKGEYFIRMLRESAYKSRDTLLAVIEGQQLLTVVSHHLPGLVFKERADERAWCPRPPKLIRNTQKRANTFSRKLGDLVDMQLNGPGERPVLNIVTSSDVYARANTIYTRYEDTGTCAVQSRARIVTLCNGPGVETYEAGSVQKKLRVVGLPIKSALTNPAAYNISDLHTLSSLLTAAEHIGLL